MFCMRGIGRINENQTRRTLRKTRLLRINRGKTEEKRILHEFSKFFNERPLPLTKLFLDRSAKRTLSNFFYLSADRFLISLLADHCLF